MLICWLVGIVYFWWCELDLELFGDFGGAKNSCYFFPSQSN
jgi:hypothetical protein